MRFACALGAFLMFLAPAANASPWLAALTRTFTLVDTSEGDLDQNGTTETAICYEATRYHRGGIVVLETRGDTQRPVLHAQTKKLCSKIKIKAGQLGVQFKDKTSVIWTLGEDLALYGAPGHPLAGLSAIASSSKSKSQSPEAALDRRLDTAWSEGKSGTGIGQTMTLRLPQELHVAAVGIYPGSGVSEKAYFANNRIHRLSIATRTKNDLGDEDSGLDFSDLGIDIGGERIDVSFENEPAYAYFAMDKRDVQEIEIRIDSVFLGQRTDDVNVAEIEVVPLLDTDEFITAKAERSAKAPPKKVLPVRPAPPEPTEEVEKTAGDKALEKIDGDGSSIVDDVEF